jgi:putative transposase
MPYRKVPFVTGDYYHIYNRGLEKQNIFETSHDYQRFLETLFYYCLENPKPKFSTFKQYPYLNLEIKNKSVEIICYCLMPNHFHLLVKQLKDGGISELMRRFIHSYNNYRNIKYSHQGPLFQGVFKAVRVESDEQLIHLSRYIHLNPFVANLTSDLNRYPWSSYSAFMGTKNTHDIAKNNIINFFGSLASYEKFLLDQQGYAKTLAFLKNSVLDEH